MVRTHRGKDLLYNWSGQMAHKHRGRTCCYLSDEVDGTHKSRGAPTALLDGRIRWDVHTGVGSYCSAGPSRGYTHTGGKCKCTSCPSVGYTRLRGRTFGLVGRNRRCAHTGGKTYYTVGRSRCDVHTGGNTYGPARRNRRYAQTRGRGCRATGLRRVCHIAGAEMGQCTCCGGSLVAH